MSKLSERHQCERCGDSGLAKFVAFLDAVLCRQCAQRIHCDRAEGVRKLDNARYANKRRAARKRAESRGNRNATGRSEVAK